MKRREFLSIAALIPLFAGTIYSQPLSVNDSESRKLFDRMIARLKKLEFHKLPIGELMGKIGIQLIGTEYAGGTLEGPGETCRVSLHGLDCVTFVELTLCTARILKKGKTSFDDLVKEITFTRYRKGKITDYTSRLHYTSEWIIDNVEKKVIKDMGKELNADQFQPDVYFMSENPKYYNPLLQDTSLISKMKYIEKEINWHKLYYIPKKQISEIEDNLKTGDIIAITTSKNGLDYSHMGLAIHENDVIRLMHASSKRRQVVLDSELNKYMEKIESNTGISVLRPL